MTAIVASHTPFAFNGRAGQSPQIQLPGGTPAMVVVALAVLNSPSPDNTASLANLTNRNQASSSVFDNLGNQYLRVSVINANNLLINQLLYQEIWVAFVPVGSVKSITVGVTYPCSTLGAADVLVIIPSNPANQLTLDNTIMLQENQLMISGSVGSGTTFTEIDNNNSASVANELVLSFVNYLFQNTPPTSTPTAPNISPVLPSALIEVINNIATFNSPATGGVNNIFGVGLAVLSQILTGANNTSAIFSTGPSTLTYTNLTLGILEVPSNVYPVQEPFISTPQSPENISQVATPVPGLSVIKLPLGT